VLDLVPRRVAGDDQRQQGEAGAGGGHQDRHQPLLRAADDQVRPERLPLEAAEVIVVRQQHDAVPRRDADHGDEPDQRAERHDAAGQRHPDHAADQRERQAEPNQGGDPGRGELEPDEEQDADQTGEPHRPQPLARLLERGIFPQHLRVVAGREGDARDRRLDPARHRAEVGAGDVERHVEPPLAVLAPHLVGGGDDADVGDVAQADRGARGRLDHQVADLVRVVPERGVAPQRDVERLLVAVDLAQLLPGDQRLRLAADLAGGEAEGDQVVSLFLPYLAVERLRRQERSTPRPPERARLELPVDDDPGACSVPRGGGWRPGARWARAEEPDRATVARQIAAMPAHARPPMRELGRRSEAAEHPFKRGVAPDEAPAVAGAAPVDDAPLALVDKVGRREEVVAACGLAAALGIHVGMAATHARALVSDLDCRPAQPQADAALLGRLALFAVRRWTPIAAAAPPDGLWLDLSGCDHLHGGERRFCRRLLAFCRRAGFTARVAIAETPGVAHAVARFGRDDLTIVAPGGIVEALAPLPLVALRLDGVALGAARRFGFERVTDLLPVARGPLARRLGMAAITRLDQALGAVAEPIVPREDAGIPSVERRLLEPIGTAEAIEQVMADLLGDLAAVLQERGLGVRALRLVCFRVDGGEQVVAVATSRPTREVAHLLRLLKLKVERIDPGMGLEQFRLVAPHTEPLDALDLGAVLAGETLVRDPARLVDVVAGRIGARSVFRVAPIASHVPERAVTLVDPVTVPGRWPAWPRPVRLLQRPEPLSGVIALLPDQPPRRFEWRGTTYRVAAGDGPERIHGEWWRRDAEVWAVRDYYRVEEEGGGRYWVFRRGDGVEADTGDLSWWMHGVFA